MLIIDMARTCMDVGVIKQTFFKMQYTMYHNLKIIKEAWSKQDFSFEGI